MPSESVKKAAAVIGLAVVGAAAIIGTYVYLTSDEEFGEDRPPIIVQNGSVDISSMYADEKYQNKGVWAKDTTSGAKTWGQSHQHDGPKKTRNTIFNATTCGGSAANLRNGGLKITFTNGLGTTWFVEVGPGTGQDGKDQMRIDPKESAVKFELDASDSSHLVVKPVDEAAGATRISKVESLNGSGFCDFNAGTQPIIIMEQKK